MQHYFKILLCFDDDDDIALLDITDAVYNWLVNFFSERRHCTRYGGCTSAMLDISASTIQGSAVGPVAYVINTGDLATVVQAAYTSMQMTRTSLYRPAMSSIERLNLNMSRSNLKLNRTKSVKVIFSSRRKPQECHPRSTKVTGDNDHHTWSHVDQSFLHQ